MNTYERRVLEDFLFGTIWPSFNPFTAGVGQTDFVVKGSWNVTYDVPQVWVNGQRLFSGVSWVNANTVRVQPGPGIGRTVMIIIAVGANSGFLPRAGTLPMTGPLDMGGQPIVNVGQGAQGSSAARLQDTGGTNDSRYLMLSGQSPMEGDLGMGDHKITGLKKGTNPTDAMRVDQASSLLPPGATIIWPGATAPAGWLMCDGAQLDKSVPINTQLFDAIGYIHSPGITSGNYFNVPDYKGYFVRGLDTTGTIDKQPGRTLGSEQLEQVGKHKHPVQLGGNFRDETSNPHKAFTTSIEQYLVDLGLTSFPDLPDGVENRPRNKAAHYIIKL